MVRELFAFCLNFYKKTFSQILPFSCRFYPSCAEYMKEAILRKGVLKGILLGFLRILRCHPLNPGGFDPLE